MSKIKKSKCLLCDYEGEFKIKLNINNHDIIECPKCCFQFMDVLPTDEEIENIYKEEYFSSWSGEGDTEYVAIMKKKSFSHILKGILKYVNKGNILDVGSATGFLLELAKEIGFEPYGIEFSEYASSIAKNKFGSDRIYNGVLETSNFQNNFFDLVTMCDVIEHVKDPIAALSKVNKLLKKVSDTETYVLITTPNTNSFTAKLFKSKWHRYLLEHLIYFNLKSMKVLAEKTGFEIIESYNCTKVINFNYLYPIAKRYNKFLISNLVYFFNSIPIINKIDIPILMGEATYILKKIKDI
ncbi:class I SAM-dependent methyltransferase [Brachyspira hyodysenteriae]|uniref:class I SAM-dependent methyltransferase n=1 Tax=Brachyspira hyodysenteriae TaxID=159 RepID=UPI001FD208BE|nr:class I SAM-dependent methyltransferase [Brachyspira hyodysenteriae]MCZ9886673.1 class I SAM-dependent methyltransferase [Brachyspira hyodysenteriae]MCZ9889444.1 class I SAM-dependent methyltransferase [Brachyspira hyodysenteriae]MCZ9919564.1 class I SAM-dependent methyltransferase [Brachyspira hyodysenteriae]MCZ9964281.1 class I SAM-dependent methyltransferase [Brachyspira hyodysenteriae]MDA0023714.1 class I SAM-dependent methyltransferase [Brachyspira hyodysenteriae]